MNIKSLIITFLACTVTFLLSQSEQPVFLKVDLQKIIQKRAIILSSRNYSKEKLDLELLKTRKEIRTLLKNLSHKKTIILTSPSFGDIKDVTEDVLKSLEEKEDKNYE